MPSLSVTSFSSCPISAAGPVDYLKPLQHVDIEHKPEAAYSRWHAVLEKLRKAPVVTFGTPQELAGYQSFVTSCIRKAAELAAADNSWTDCVEAILVPLQRALELVKAGKTSSARCLAVELIGYAHLAQLAEQLKCGNGNALDRCIGQHSGSARAICSSTSICSSSSSACGSGPQFKVPALPLKRQRSPNAEEQKQLQVIVEATPQPERQLPQQRRHSAPKRRATPQVWTAGPICMSPTAPPSSSMHGETCCDEALLPFWCPISGKRQKLDSTDSSDYVQEPNSVHGHKSIDDAVAVSAVAGQHPKRQPLTNSLSPRASSTSTRSNSLMQQASAAGPVAAAAPAAVMPRSAQAEARADATAALKLSMHEDPDSKPAADVLLFMKTQQLPIVSWTGAIKHKAKGRVVEVCTLSLQVPEAFLEEFPKALYAADICHRKSVSLGRHVVCRANLQPLSEHQLASLAVMARSQLVALCTLQTAELHLVPYFDNKNHVRCVGFLKIKAT